MASSKLCSSIVEIQLVQDYIHLHSDKDTGEINYFTDFKDVSVDFRVHIIKTGELGPYSESEISNYCNKPVNKL